MTFDDPHAATTYATITASGHYVLQLRATDGELSTAAQVTLDVQLGAPVRQGWISGVEWGASVSGQVPITVAPGVTLVSGVLKYYSVSSTADNAIVLNPNTTGSGTIGTLDTTLLANGAYWIELEATDSTGSHQFNLCLINVVGDYKPGRTTATVTDRPRWATSATAGRSASMCSWRSRPPTM